MLTRRTPIKRSPLPPRRTPLRRSRKPIRQRRAKPRRDGRVRDTERMLWIKKLRCCAPQPHVCWNSPDVEPGQVECHHAGKKPGMGIKADDDTGIPLCSLAHRQCESYSGPFRGWTGEQMRGWHDQQIAETRALWDRRASQPHVEMAF
jgi:hypothetical protein